MTEQRHTPEQNWTPEPWGPHKPFTRLMPGEWSPIYTQTPCPVAVWPICDEEFARACACVNACAGIPDPTTLRAQRDALLAAAQSVLMTHIPSGLDTGHVMVPISDLNALRSAIDLAEAGPSAVGRG